VISSSKGGEGLVLRVCDAFRPRLQGRFAGDPQPDGAEGEAAEQRACVRGVDRETIYGCRQHQGHSEGGQKGPPPGDLYGEPRNGKSIDRVHTLMPLS